MPWVPVRASSQMLAYTGSMALLLLKKKKKKEKRIKIAQHSLKMKAHEHELFKFRLLLQSFVFFGTQSVGGGKKTRHIHLS